MNNEETGGTQIVTSEYNKLRTEEYLHLRGRFYKRFPKSLESDYEFEQEIFLHFDILQAEVRQLEAKLKEKDELLFAYESVNAPVNPLLSINKDLERRLKAHSAGEAVRHFCRECLKAFWNVDDEPIVCPHRGSKEMPIVDPDAERIA